MLLRLICGAGLALLLSPAAIAVECSAASGPARVALLELYTSEGCSSCPPADRWLSQLSAQGYYADRVIPLALHVDYWDYIGWRDPFANPGFSARQREMARLGRSSVVYTPQVMINGRDFRSWYSSGSFAREIDAMKQAPARANIQLKLSKLAADRVEARVSVTGRKDNLLLYLALYENDLWSAVSAGENAGVKLHHDYVVREWRGPLRVGDTILLQTLPLKPTWQSAKTGVVAFLQDASNGEVVQALQLKMCS